MPPRSYCSVAITTDTCDPHLVDNGHYTRCAAAAREWSTGRARGCPTNITGPTLRAAGSPFAELVPGRKRASVVAADRAFRADEEQRHHRHRWCASRTERRTCCKSSYRHRGSRYLACRPGRGACPAGERANLVDWLEQDVGSANLARAGFDLWQSCRVPFMVDEAARLATVDRALNADAPRRAIC